LTVGEQDGYRTGRPACVYVVTVIPDHEQVLDRNP
jgi:hypothetical protein